MVSSSAQTVEDYLASLPAERRDVVAAMRSLIQSHLPAGYVETMNWGMISYEIPLADYPQTYNNRPLNYIALAAQKNHFALYLSAVYGDAHLEQRLRSAFLAAGKKLDMGKSCVRFKRSEDLPLDALGEIIAAVPPKKFIEIYEKARNK
jgi:uncharacterized protein YdhG (YjbR/CyaY superfamily)